MQVIRRRGFVLLVIWLLPVCGIAQSLFLRDTVSLFSVARLADSGSSPVKYQLAQDLEYSLSFSGLQFTNWHQGADADVLSLLHHVKYRMLFTNLRKIKITNFLTHDLGIQYFFDSIFKFQPDESNLDTRIEFDLGKRVNVTIFSKLSTCLFNTYLYEAALNGARVKKLRASFLSPLLWSVSSGFGWTQPGMGTLSLGLVTTKLTWLRNRLVYPQQDVAISYGVPDGKSHLFEYGLSMHLLVDKEVLKRVHWNCDLLVFKNYQKPVDLVMKNIIGVKISRFLKISIQTRLNYEQEVSRYLQVENQLSVGFYYNL